MHAFLSSDNPHLQSLGTLPQVPIRLPVLSNDCYIVAAKQQSLSIRPAYYRGEGRLGKLFLSKLDFGLKTNHTNNIGNYS